MNQNEIDRFCENLHLVADAYIDMFQKLVDTFKPIFERISEVYETFKTKYSDVHEKYYERKEHIESIRRGWNVKRDTRQMSQVIDRRPKVIVRKVI